MIRLIGYLVLIALIAAGLGWLADRPGTLVVNWQGTDIETSVFAAVVMLIIAAAAAILVWTILKQIVMGRTILSRFAQRRRSKQGLEALSGGMIAIGAGDRAGATRYALAARRALPNEPLTILLRAQAAQLVGDRSTARRIYESMLSNPDTELLGLRGLFLEAEREKETAAAQQFAARALKLNPKLAWSGEGLLATQARSGDWPGVLETLAVMRKHDQIDRKRADRLRAVALTASAIGLEDSDTDKALQQSVEAHELAPDLVPAAVVAGRIHASRGNTGKAVAILQRAWKKTQHPDLVTIYAYVKPGEAATERLKRVRELAQLIPSGSEGAIAVAGAALEARDFDAARKALESISGSALTARVCLLMAKIEGAERGDAGRVREWLSRAARAPRDPAWVAGDHVADHWMPVSPVSGEFDAYRWKVPDAALSVQNGAALLDGLLPSLSERHASGPQVEGSVGEIVEAGARKESEDVASGAMAAAMAAMFAGSGSGNPARKGSDRDDANSDDVVTPRAIRPGKIAGQGHADGVGNVTAFERGTASSYAEQSQMSEGRLAGRSFVGDGLSDDSEAAEPAAPEVKASAWTGMGSFKRIVGGGLAASTSQLRRADRDATDVIVVAPHDERGAVAEPVVGDPVAQQRRDPAA